MGAMYRLKAYFGMVPTEDMAEYADEPPADRYAGRRVREYAGERWGDDYPSEREYAGASREVRVEERSAERYDDWDRRPVRQPSRPLVERPREVVARLDREPVRGMVGVGSGSSSAVRGALAMDTDALREPVLRETVLREPSRLPERPTQPPAPERLGGAAALARITTLQPRSYNEARTIGERYRDGVPVIMNLTELDDAAAKRLVDFAAGLVFAVRGTIERVTNKVFLLSPPNVTVAAEDKQRIAEGGFFNQS
jgi:cell division inhibitor SepF